MPVPDTVLSVAVFVGEPEEADADLVQLYEREEGAVRGRDAVLLRDGEQVATVVDLPWEDDDPTHLERARAVDGRVVLAGGLDPGNVARRDRRSAARGPWTRARAWRSSPGSRITTACARSWRRPDEPFRPCQGSDPCHIRRSRSAMSYGEYGGRYVPETLIPALDELDAGWRERPGRSRPSPPSSTGSAASTAAGRRR